MLGWKRSQGSEDAESEFLWVQREWDRNPWAEPWMADQPVTQPVFPCCLSLLVRAKQSLCLWALLTSMRISLSYAGCCLNWLAFSVWEPSAVCQAPYLSRMLMSIKYYGTWSLLRSLMLCISWIQIRSWLKALLCCYPSLLANGIQCELGWALPCVPSILNTISFLLATGQGIWSWHCHHSSILHTQVVIKNGLTAQEGLCIREVIFQMQTLRVHIWRSCAHLLERRWSQAEASKDERDSILAQCADPSAPISRSTDLVGVQFAPAAGVFAYLFSLN